MQKIFTPDFKTTPENVKERAEGLKESTLNNILNFSRSLEVLKPKAPVNGKKSTVEIVLN